MGTILPTLLGRTYVLNERFYTILRGLSRHFSSLLTTSKQRITPFSRDYFLPQSFGIHPNARLSLTMFTSQGTHTFDDIAFFLGQYYMVFMTTKTRMIKSIKNKS